MSDLSRIRHLISIGEKERSAPLRGADCFAKAKNHIAFVADKVVKNKLEQEWRDGLRKFLRLIEERAHGNKIGLKGGN